MIPRQSTAPMQFEQSRRIDQGSLKSSARAGVVSMFGAYPILRGDSASGQLSVDIELAEMPKPLLNGVNASVSAWFVPWSALPKFDGMDEFRASYQGETIKGINGIERAVPKFFSTLSQGRVDTWTASDMFKQMGYHHADGLPLTDVILDSYNLVQNFRQSAYSSKLERRQYVTDPASSVAALTSLAPAFWAPGPFDRVVPDYDRALVVGQLDLDMVAGQVPVTGITRSTSAPGAGQNARITATTTNVQIEGENLTDAINFEIDQTQQGIFGNFDGDTVTTSLRDIDTARKSQAFAKAAQAYFGGDYDGFRQGDTYMAELLQGFSVPPEEHRRPWLLANTRVPFGFAQRFATDSGNLDASVSQGVAQAVLNVNLPRQEVGGTILVLVEVLPERVFERQFDNFLHTVETSDLPDAMRDVQRVEPVDMVPNYRVDTAHTDGSALYGWEPMNNIWQRSFTRLGGSFYQPDPAAPTNEARSAIWQAQVVDPVFSQDHFLAPQPFPHDVFADTTADAYEIVLRHSLSIVGSTQFGDVLAENMDVYDDIRPLGAME